MSPRTQILIFVSFIVTVVVFELMTSGSLPEIVASHFNATGAADGYMPRRVYIGALLLIVIGAPLVVAVLPYQLGKRRSHSLNIPHRSYWLAPARREETLTFLWQHGLWFAAILAVFLAYVHWLVVTANRLQPPQLASADLLAALGCFFILLIVWLVLLFRRFRLPN